MDTPVMASDPAEADDVYSNSADTGVVPGANLDEDEEEVGTRTVVNAGGLTRADSGDIDPLSDNRTGNNSMGTSAIGGFGVGSINTDATLPE